MYTIEEKNKSLLIWLEAARPQTLPAAFVPVWLGGSLAWHNNVFNVSATAMALVCAFLIQIGTNFANDYFDYKSGADNEHRIGFIRATSAGLIPASEMLSATVLTMGAAFLTGLYLVWIAGWPIFLLGLLSLIFGVAYTGGPYPLGYNGLGDVFVFLFFGIVAVTGTYYVNALEWSGDAFWASLAAGALSTNILVINNLRDIEQDKDAGKKTLGVLLGEHALKLEYSVMMLLAYFIPLYFYVQLGYDIFILSPYATFPLAIHLVKKVWSVNDKTTLNKTLIQTARFMFIFGLLLGLSIIFTT